VRFSLRIPESASLKDKRQVVRSVTQRIRNRFGAAVAEVGDNDAWQLATLGAAVVSNDAHHCDAMLREIVEYVDSSRLDAELLDVETEVFPFD
jgi:uncharacterized protein